MEQSSISRIASLTENWETKGFEKKADAEFELLEGGEGGQEQVSERSERSLEEDEHSRDGSSRNGCADKMSTSSTKLTHSIRLNSPRLASLRSAQEQEETVTETSPTLMTTSTDISADEHFGYQSSWFMQFYLCFHRTVLVASRNKPAIYGKVSVDENENTSLF